MLTITKRREFKEVISYEREFRYLDDNSAGFSFTVDERGNVITEYPEARRNFEACLTGEVDGRKVRDLGIGRRISHVSYPAEGRCVCGSTVVLDGDVECDCGRWYNAVGQELKHPSLWEEDY